MDRGTWPATVHGVTKNRARLKWLSTHASYPGLPRWLSGKKPLPAMQETWV